MNATLEPFRRNSRHHSKAYFLLLKWEGQEEVSLVLWTCSKVNFCTFNTKKSRNIYALSAASSNHAQLGWPTPPNWWCCYQKLTVEILNHQVKTNGVYKWCHCLYNTHPLTWKTDLMLRIESWRRYKVFACNIFRSISPPLAKYYETFYTMYVSMSFLMFQLLKSVGHCFFSQVQQRKSFTIIFVQI